MMHRFPRYQAGLGLAELLVALALGLGVLLGASSFLVASVRAHLALRDALAMDENARFALSVLARSVRQGTLADSVALLTPGPVLPVPAAPARIQGLDASALSRTAPGIGPALAPAHNGSDVLAVRFPGTGPGLDGDGATRDCAGLSIGQAREGWNIFYVARDSQGVAELRCKYHGQGGWSSEAIIAGVDGFQVLYGVDLDGDGAPNGYLSANAIEALDGGAPPGQSSHWTRVVSVRVALLMPGPRLARGLAGRAHYQLFGAAYPAAASAPDVGTTLLETELAGASGEQRLRRVYDTTIALAVGP